MQLKYICPFWGLGHMSAPGFIEKVNASGYDGIEIDIPRSASFEEALLEKIEEVRTTKEFIFVAQQWLPSETETFNEYRQRYTSRLQQIISLEPDFINSHTGKDFFSFDENCMLLDIAMDLSAKSGIKILHETHRGRFSFHAHSLLPYLIKFPALELVLDVSHWCTVSESLLQDQQQVIDAIIPHVAHIHARIGHEQSPQVNDFRAPEWNNHVETFMQWWEQIITHQKQNGKPQFTICPEFGPAPYLPTQPFTNEPLANQWELNVAMMQMLKNRFLIVEPIAGDDYKN